MQTKSRHTAAWVAGAVVAAAAIWLVRRARTHDRHEFIDATNLDEHASRATRRSFYAEQPLSEPA